MLDRFDVVHECHRETDMQSAILSLIICRAMADNQLLDLCEIFANIVSVILPADLN